MASEAKTATSSLRVAPDDRTAIGISFGNSNSSIAFTFDDRVEVIANEDGGMFPHETDRASLTVC